MNQSSKQSLPRGKVKSAPSATINTAVRQSFVKESSKDFEARTAAKRVNDEPDDYKSIDRKVPEMRKEHFHVNQRLRLANESWQVEECKTNENL
jgi:hypothetical protein